MIGASSAWRQSPELDSREGQRRAVWARLLPSQTNATISIDLGSIAYDQGRLLVTKTDTTSTSNTAGSSTSRENVPINALRAGAALMVVVSHARILLLADFDDVAHTPIQSLLYAVTALGHEAVVVFFILSGYWVGGSAMRKIRRSDFEWRSYLIDRVARLWIVLIPALVVTLILDMIGEPLFGVPPVRVGDSSPLAFIGNMFFLGGVRVDTFGTNSPLWSLGFEFWMYILGPLLMLIFTPWNKRSFIYVVGVIAVAVMVGVPVFTYLPLWMAGVLVARLQLHLDGYASRISSTSMSGIRVVALVATFAVAIAGRTVLSMPAWLTDFMVAVPATILIASLAARVRHQRPKRGPQFRFAGLAHSSYSLYAIHMPILAMLVPLMGTVAPAPWPSDGLHWVYLLLAVALVVVLGWLFSLVTEKYTDLVRNTIKQRLRIGVVPRP